MASLACPHAAQATVSTEASASTCPMGPTAGERGRGQEVEGSARESKLGENTARDPERPWDLRMSENYNAFLRN